MIRFARSAAIPTDVPWYDLDPPQQDLLWNGSGPFPGIRGFFAALERKKYKLHVRVFLSKYRGYALCPDCHGQRLRAEARAVLINNKNICEVTSLTITAAQAFFDNLQLTPAQTEIAGKVLEEVRQRIHFLMEVGLEYLTLDRLSSTLSGGESQRIQLATSLGSRLVGALYVLDEPSIGLHARDTAKLIRILHSLRDLGNTILVVEHDPAVIRSADHLLDLGPGAGELGGHVLAAGTVAAVTANPNSITGKYLSGRLTIPVPRHRRQPGDSKARLQLTGVRLHNLRGIDVDIPLNLLCCVTGVSGSGKSTLIHQVLYRALMQTLHREPDASAPEPTTLFRSLTGTQHLNDVVLVDQSPIGRTPRSNPVTYIKAFDDIRALFAAQPDAKRRGFGPGPFSFNVPGGRCDTCEGDGTVTVEMQFLADIELPCEDCNGTRYKSSILEIKYKSKNIHDVFNMTVKHALSSSPESRASSTSSPSSTRSAWATSASANPPPRSPAARPSASSSPRTSPRPAPTPSASAAAPTYSINPANPPPRKSPPARVAALYTSSTSPPPASTSTTCRSSSQPSASSSTAAARCSSSSTTSTSSSPPTGSSTSAPKAATPAARSSPPVPPKPSPPTPAPTPATTSAPSSEAPQPVCNG